MSEPNGYDARGEDEALRKEFGDLVQHQATTDRRVSDVAHTTANTLDRIALSLGRIDVLEQTTKRMEKMIEAIAATVGAV